MSMERYSPDSHKWPMNRRVYAIEFCVGGVWQWRHASGLFITATEAKKEARKLRDGIACVRYRVRLLLIGRVVRTFAERGKYTFKRTANEELKLRSERSERR